jgi:predicted DNA-binding transcriptional regulator AlpA
MKQGELPAIKMGRSVRYAQADIDAFIAKSRTGGG